MTELNTTFNKKVMNFTESSILFAYYRTQDTEFTATKAYVVPCQTSMMKSFMYMIPSYVFHRVLNRMLEDPKHLL